VLIKESSENCEIISHKLLLLLLLLLVVVTHFIERFSHGSHVGHIPRRNVLVKCRGLLVL